MGNKKQDSSYLFSECMRLAWKIYFQEINEQIINEAARKEKIKKANDLKKYKYINKELILSGRY